MSFPLLANESISSTVENFIKYDRIPHAILIEGDEGVGKHTLARFIALGAVCSESDKPCNFCKQCIMAKNGSNPDVITVLPEENKKNFSVDQIRSLRQDAYVKPHSAEKKVYIIDGAERMNEQSQNALLKILEEPPKNVIFILVTFSKTSLLQTIRSRCITLSLVPPEESVAVAEVERVCGCEKEIALEAVRKSKNSIGLAIKYVAKKNEDVALKVAREFLQGLFTFSELELLKLLQTVSRDRKTADDFFMQLKILIAHDIRENYTLKERSKILSKLYENTDYYTMLLKKNINLSLLFSSMVCDIKCMLV